jgi:protein-S-isoprenylcysteine O-methyltransferase Ste14
VSSDPEAVPGVPVGEMVLTWTLLVAACAAGALVTGEFTRTALRAGAPFLLAGGLLALTSVRALGRGRDLVTRGPYRWVRHPYFLGIRVTLMRARREEHNLCLRFGDAYHKYMESVGLILPLRPPLPRARRP